MSSKIRFASLLLVLAGVAQLLYLDFSNGKAGAVAAPAPALAQAAQGSSVPQVMLALSPDQPVAVDLSADGAALADLSPREREDQQRDWLLFAAVASLGLPADAYVQVFFDLPPTRQGYMRPVAAFEYGKTRSRLVRDGVVLALLPAGMSAQQRRDDLGHVADTHRKTQGGAFDRIMVVEYKLDGASGKASLVRRGDVPYQTVFSDAYGYVEREIGDRRALDEFMAEVDDLTLMRKTDSGLILGGRKSPASARQNIGVEEVATIWQSEQAIEQGLQQFKEYVKEQEEEFEAKWGEKTYSDEQEKKDLERQIQPDIDAVRARIEDYRRKHAVREASGFSLDPAFNYPKLAQVFEKFSNKLMPLLDESITPESIRDVALALNKGDMGPYEAFKRNSNSPVLFPLLESMEKPYGYQAARYDGELEGTEVGMVLFYTDLLAKLWTIDFMQTSPARGPMPVFLDDPMAVRKLSPVYMAEARELSSARLWFGHTDQGYQLSSTGDAVLLAPNATRIFSAGANPEKPGEEVQTSAVLAASIDWWNDHYEEVATLEPQYQRLNQIMKWSVLIAWLNQSGEGDKLKFLEGVKVRRDFTFGSWTRQRPELRFTQWSAIGLRPPGTNGIATESMPILSGEVTGGGVSLASKQDLKLGALANDLAPALRRSTLRTEAGIEGKVLKTADNNVFRFQQGEGAAIVSAKADSTTKLRALSAEFANTEIEHAFKVIGGRVEVASKVGSKPLESLHIERTPNGFSVGLRAADMAHAHRLANMAAKDASPQALLADPMVESLIRIGDDASYAVKLRDSVHWVRLDPEKSPSVALESGWLMRAAPPGGPGTRVVRAKLMNDDELLAELPGPVHVVVGLDGDGRSFLHAVTAAPPGMPLGTVDTGSGVLKASINPASKSIHLVSDAAWNESTLHLARRLGPAQIEAIRKRGKLVLPPDGPPAVPLIAALRKGDYRSVAASIAGAPADAKQQLAKVLAEENKRNTQLRVALGPDDALHHIDGLIDVYGPQPELLVRKGMLQIERGNLEAAVQIAARKPTRPLPERGGLYDEVNARMTMDDGVSFNLWRYTQHVDQANASFGKKSPGFMRPTTDGNHFDFDFVFNDKPAVRVVSSAAGIPAGANVYRQASAGLNGIDWSAPANVTLAQVMQLRLGTVLHLTEDSIANYRPTAVWLPDGLGGKVQLTAAVGKTVVRENGRMRCGDDESDGSCQPVRDSKAPRDVYLVMVN